jgi:hypothetical protein
MKKRNLEFCDIKPTGETFDFIEKLSKPIPQKPQEITLDAASAYFAMANGTIVDRNNIPISWEAQKNNTLIFRDRDYQFNPPDIWMRMSDVQALNRCGCSECVERLKRIEMKFTEANTLPQPTWAIPTEINPMDVIKYRYDEASNTTFKVNDDE